MKIWPIVGILAFVFLGLSSPRPAEANEGRISLRAGSVSCEGVSIWESNRYQVIGRCQGLSYPYAERLDRYVLWVQGEGESNPTRLGEVERGLFDVQTDKRFTNIIITAEEEGNPRQPGSTVAASGNVSPYDFSSQPQASQPVVNGGAQSAISPTPTITSDSEATRSFLGNTSTATIVIVVVVALMVVFGIISFLRR